MWPFNKKKVLDKPIQENKEQPIQENKEQPIKTKKERFDITIFLGDGRQYGYNQTYNIGSKKTCVICFLAFYRWFYERESPYFTFVHSQGVDILIRSEIKSISMRKSIIEE